MDILLCHFLSFFISVFFNISFFFLYSLMLSKAIYCLLFLFQLFLFETPFFKKPANQYRRPFLTIYFYINKISYLYNLNTVASIILCQTGFTKHKVRMYQYQCKTKVSIYARDGAVMHKHKSKIVTVVYEWLKSGTFM